MDLEQSKDGDEKVINKNENNVEILLKHFDEFVSSKQKSISSLKIENNCLLKEVKLLRNELQQTQNILSNKNIEIQEMNSKEYSTLLKDSKILNNENDKINNVSEKFDLTKEVTRLSNLNQELREELHQERAERIRLSRQ